MDIRFRIRRYNPENANHSRPYWQEYELTEVQPTDRVLELLHRVKWEQDGTLTFRRSCSAGICGSDAMRINGVNRLACKLLIRDVGPQVQVEPILGLPVLKDLVVDMEPFFAHYRRVMPYLVNDEPVPADGRERLQSPEARSIYDDSTNCILCAACTTSCPSFWADGEYYGPAAIVQAHRFLFDDRDRADEERLQVLNAGEGVWRCRTVFNCTSACPRDIEVTRAIGEVKMAIRKGTTDDVIQPFSHEKH